MTKSVKFESSRSRSPLVSTPTPLSSTPEKPSQLGLKKIIKPASMNIETIYYDNKNATVSTAVALNRAGDENRYRSFDAENVVWPQIKKKLSFKNPYISNSNASNSNYYDSTGIGADLYDTNEEKVTVL